LDKIAELAKIILSPFIQFIFFIRLFKDILILGVHLLGCNSTGVLGHG